MDFTKGKEYYRSLDKRTKEYRDYRDFVSKQSDGLGDSVKKALKKVGITEDSLSKLGFKDCGCDERRGAMNKAFRYKRAKCLTEKEFIYLSEWFEKKKSRVTVEEQSKMVGIHNRVFDSNKEVSSCTSCVRELIVKLEKLVNIHKK